jgi:hypothetical protein
MSHILGNILFSLFIYNYLYVRAYWLQFNYNSQISYQSFFHILFVIFTFTHICIHCLGPPPLCPPLLGRTQKVSMFENIIKLSILKKYNRLYKMNFISYLVFKYKLMSDWIETLILLLSAKFAWILYTF